MRMVAHAKPTRIADMTPNVEALYQAALALPEDERAELVDWLLNSLLPDLPYELHSAWPAELRGELPR